MAKETAEEAHQRIMGDTAESPANQGDPNEREAMLLSPAEPEVDELARESEPVKEEESQPETEAKPLHIESGKEKSLADLRKLLEEKDAQIEQFQSQANGFDKERESFQAKLAKYDLQETDDFKSKYTQPMSENAEAVSVLWKTYTGSDLTRDQAFAFFRQDYQRAKSALEAAGIDRTSKFMELWEETKLIQEKAKEALSDAPSRIQKAKLADSEAEQSRQRIEAQRAQKRFSDVRSDIKTNVVGFVELADNPEYNAHVQARLAKFDETSTDPSSSDAAMLIAKGIVYDDLLAEVMSLKSSISEKESHKQRVEQASRVNGVRAYSEPKAAAREGNREAHARIFSG